MAEMQIVIQAVDKATAEIAKINKSLGGMTSAMSASASATTRSAATTRAGMDNIAAGTRDAGIEFGKMAVAWKLTMRVLGSSQELSDAISAVHSFAGTLVAAGANAIGLGDALRGMSAMAAIAGGEQKIQQLQEALERLKASASWTPASMPGSDYAMREIAALEKEIERIKDSVIIARRAIYTELGLETQTKLIAEVRKEVAATDAAAVARKKVADETERQLRDAASIGLLSNADKVAMQAGAANVAVRDLVRIRAELEAAGVGFAGMSLEDSFDIINREIDEMRAVALGAAAALQGLKFGLSEGGAQALGAGVAASIKAANQALEDFEPAAIEAAEAVDGATMSVDELDAALHRLIGTSEHIEDPEKSGFVAIGTQQLKELTQLADDFGLRSLPSMASALASLELRATAEEMASLAYGFGASETQVAALTAALGDLKKKEKEFLITNEEIANQVGGDFADAFMSVIDGTKSVAQAFSEMIRSIISDLLHMFVQKYITKVIFNALGGAGGGVGTPPGLQHGGTVTAGVPRLVGERGPELFVPHQSGYVNNNANTMGGGGTTVNFVISAVDGPSVAAMLRREKDTIKAVVASAMATDTRFRASLN